MNKLYFLLIINSYFRNYVKTRSSEQLEMGEQKAKKIKYKTKFEYNFTYNNTQLESLKNINIINCHVYTMCSLYKCYNSQFYSGKSLIQNSNL